MPDHDAMVLAISDTLDSLLTLDDFVAEIVWRLRAGGISDAAIRNTLLHYPPREIIMRERRTYGSE